MDQCIIKKERSEAVTGWKPVTISIEIYSQLKEISEETNLSLGKIACMLLDFALERVVVKEE